MLDTDPEVDLEDFMCDVVRSIAAGQVQVYTDKYSYGYHVDPYEVLRLLQERVSDGNTTTEAAGVQDQEAVPGVAA
jgi:hypothetical protein